MSLSKLGQFAYQKKNEYPCQQTVCGGSTENHRLDCSFYPLTPNKASTTTVPETPPSLRSTYENDACHLAYARRVGQKKRYNRLSSSSEEEEKSKPKGKHCLTPTREKVKPNTFVTIFSKLPSSKRKKRAQEDPADDDNTVEKAVNSVKLAHTKERSTVCRSMIAAQDTGMRSSFIEGEGDLSTLFEMFPQCEKSDLETIFYNNNKDLDETVSLLIGSPLKNASCRRPKRRKCRYQLIESDDDLHLNMPQIEQTNGAFRSDKKRKRKIKIDTGSSSSSDSDDPCSNISISSAKTQSKSSKDRVPSPIWLSARTKLQSYSFHKKNARREIGTAGDDLTHSEQENIEPIYGSLERKAAPLLIVDSESGPYSSHPLSPQTALSLPCAKDQPPNSTEEESSCSTDSEDEFGDKQKEAIMNFLNGASEDGLRDIPGCSRTKAKLFAQCLPVDKWETLVGALISTRGLNEQLLKGCLKLLEERKVLVKLLSECRIISSSLQETLLQLKTEVSSNELVATLCIAQPNILSSRWSDR